ncbi:MAG: hypothetical protein QM610_06485 [Chitinophagaceae bacterium]
MNRKIVDSVRLKQDAFGSVSGVFSIPKNVLTERFTIDIYHQTATYWRRSSP